MNTVSVRDRATVTEKHSLQIIGRESDGVISLTLGDLERSDRSHLLKNTVSLKDSAIITEEHS